MKSKIDLSAIIVYYQKYEYDDIKSLFNEYKPMWIKDLVMNLFL